MHDLVCYLHTFYVFVLLAARTLRPKKDRLGEIIVGIVHLAKWASCMLSNGHE